MSYVDVAIPLVIGLLLTVRPHSFLKSTGSEVGDAAKADKVRKIGFVLLGVAALYFVIKLASG